ncbi:MAG: tyrosine-type recombinase/integrase [Eubacteriales bacterium]
MAKQKKNTDARGYVRKILTLDGDRYDLRAKNEEELDKKILQLKIDQAQGRLKLDKNTSVKTWADQWLSVYKKGKIADAYYKDLSAMFDNHILPSIGKYKLCEIKALHLQKLVNGYEGRSKAFLMHMRSALYGLFDKALSNDMILSNPARQIELPNGTYKGRRAITAEERKHILKVADEQPYAGIWIKSMLYCGLRPAEASALTWNDVDFDKNFISVKTALESGRGGKIKSPKTAAGVRTIPLPQLLKVDLLRHRLISKSDCVFTTPNGCVISRDNIKNMWNRFKRQLDLSMGAEVNKRGKIEKSVIADDLCLYCLRHTYATDLQSAGVAMNVAKYLLGHEDISTTANIYTHTADDILENARKAQDEYLKSGTKSGTN